MPALFLLGLFKDPSPRRMASQMPPTQTDNRGSFLSDESAYLHGEMELSRRCLLFVI